MARHAKAATRRPGTGLSIMLAVAMVVLFFVASIAVSFVFAVLLADDQQQHAIGINYGRVADNLPPPARVVELLQSLKIRSVKIYDANPDVLKALQSTNLRVAIMVTNQEIEQMAASSNFSDQWVQQNVAAYPATKIETAIVGNEILSDLSLRQTVWSKLVPAMENLHSSLQRLGHGKIKVTTSLAIDCLKVSFPPSEGAFRDDVSDTIIQPMLKFLETTQSPFFINVYPYFAWLDDQLTISLDYALFRGPSSNASQAEDPSGMHYDNLLDAQLDALVVAMTKLGYGGVQVSISETGWPSRGSVGASLANAADYNRRLVLRILGKNRKNKNHGTPRRPGRLIDTYIFALFNEDQKPGAATERNWGLLYPNGSKVYDIDLTGKTPVDKYPALSTAAAAPSSPAATSSSSYFSSPKANASQVPALPQAAIPGNFSTGNSSRQGQWCVAKADYVSTADVQDAIDYACGGGKADCAAIQPGQACYLPNLVRLHASYAFNSYWQKMKRSGGTCAFNGFAKLTSVDPSYGSCVYPVL
ncbi:probable glucan endo-1,3-beta-glucosidase A6 [Selaginella moellendorffii]|uniref:probable glucan endo-1,3-beta-glucosidase A6 n=1 Tax=Selaginella moellendorffii TaxID=88036 RepID=UPI000D1C6B1D|nr:probable glucan endo-1,3-beta-glucosidase A6 [Selaginella moellendorffii]|eukprot:XP_024532624.1 probable glucan endo-1,3-beta-glucosidase A6 [Selaginella moellendorffii]